MEKVVMWLPSIILLVILFSLGTFFIIKLLKRTEKQKKAISIFAIVAIILGSWNAWISGSGIVIFSLPSFIKGVQLPEAGPMWVGVRILFCINLTLAILLLVSGISILRLKIWGRVTIIIQSILSLSYNLYFLVGWIVAAHKLGIARLSQFWPIRGTLFMMAFAIFVLWFFNRPSVKAQFQKLQKV